MPQLSSTAPPDGIRPSSGTVTHKVIQWAAIVSSVAALVWFYCVELRYGGDRGTSAIGWLKSAWNPETDYEHGPLVPLVAMGLIIYRYKDLKASVTRGSLWGLAAVFLGVAIYVVGYRTLQPRITMGGLPFILWGSALYLWGWQVAKIVLFPLFFLWLAVPLPSFQQATTHLQLVATSMAHHGSSLFGVQTYVEGTTILPLKGKWEPLEIAKGCSGIRSLMALLMISAAWAYVARIALWKKTVLFLSAVPLAILGNALRVTSIFVIGEYGDAEWARNTWHDWSGLLLFYPFSLLLLLAIHSLFEGGLPWKKSRQRAVRRTVVGSDQAKPFVPEAPVERRATPPVPENVVRQDHGLNSHTDGMVAWVLPLFLGVTLSSIYLLPKVGAVAESAVNMQLPAYSGRWTLNGIPPSKEEIGTLAPDTKFSKAYCIAARPGEYNIDGYAIPDRVDLSIVLSGADINNSIHRPERCMPAQDHRITSSRGDELKLPGGRAFPVRRLVSVQNVSDTTQKGSHKFNCITYYFFVGHDKVSNDHLERTFLDMKDRIIRGMDQRWAYVSVSMWCGKVPWIENEVSEEEADAKLRKFLTEFAEKQINWDQINP